MFEDYLSRNLKEGEAVVAIVRPYWLTMGFPMFLSAALAVFDAFFLAWFVQYGAIGVALFFLILLVALLWGVRSYVVWSLNAFILTNQRIIDVDQNGFFQRTVSEASFEKIQDVSFQISGLWQTMLKFGTVIVQTAGSSNNLELTGVHHPEQLQELITKLQASVEKERAHGDSLTASELLALVRKIKSGIGTEKLREIVGDDDVGEGREEAVEEFFEPGRGGTPDLRKRRNR